MTRRLLLITVLTPGNDRNMCRKVAIYRSDLLPISETFIRDQASALTEWQPTLIGRREIHGGLSTPNVKRFIIPETGIALLRTLRHWSWLPDPQLVRYLKEQKFNLVHAHFGTDGTDVWPSVKAAGLPMLVSLHGYDINIHRWWWEKGNGGLRRRVYPSRLLKMAQEPSVYFIAVSKAVKQRAIEYGIPQEKIVVCYIGVDTERFKPNGTPIEQRKKRILFVGRMVEKKAPLLMIRAYAEVRKKISDIELAMIGTGPLLDNARTLAQDLNVPVEFLEAQSSDQVLAQMHKARVFCLPSVTALNGDAEGFGLVLLEAQACGVPVVSSAKGGAFEGLLDEKTGFRFAEKNLEECAKKIITLLSEQIDLPTISQASRDFALSKFDIKNLTTTLARKYEKLSKLEENMEFK